MHVVTQSCAILFLFQQTHLKWWKSFCDCSSCTFLPPLASISANSFICQTHSLIGSTSAFDSERRRHQVLTGWWNNRGNFLYDDKLCGSVGQKVKLPNGGLFLLEPHRDAGNSAFIDFVVPISNEERRTWHNKWSCFTWLRISRSFLSLKASTSEEILTLRIMTFS